MQKNIIIDIEFTGLDNSFINDNEIIQVKMLNTSNGLSVLQNFNSHKELGAYTQLEHKTKRYVDEPYFNYLVLHDMLTSIGVDMKNDSVIFCGFGVETDLKMLAKYGFSGFIEDIRTHFQKTEYAYRMATEGSGLEATYYIVIGEYPPVVSHADISELFLIEKLYEKMQETQADEYMSIVPFGHCAGMSIANYVQNYRRAADGYRFNNSDEFEKALSYEIELSEYYDDDYYDDEDF